MSYEPTLEEIEARRRDELLDAPLAKRKVDAPSHRMLPHSEESEMGVLCSMLLLPAEVCGICAEKKVAGSWFYNPSRADFFTHIMALWDANKPVDQITLTQSLRDANALDRVGGPAAIYDLYTYMQTAVNVEHYLETLSEKWVLREQIRICTAHAAVCYEQGEVGWTRLDDLEKSALSIRAGMSENRMEAVAKILPDAIDEINFSYEHRGEVTGLRTGFEKFDEMTSGLQKAEMIVIAARPSMGKTALGMNIVEYIALVEKKPVAVYSLEMEKKKLVKRMISSQSRVNMAKVAGGWLGGADFERINAATATLSAAPIYIDDTSSMTIEALRGSARRMKARHGIEAIVIDYLQLLRSTARRGQENRQQEVAEISSGLKALAKELQIPVVILAQLNRPETDRSGAIRNRRPRLQDLRESGAIEQDADLVAFIVRDEYYAESEEERLEVEGHATLIIAKQRNGPTGDVPLTFHKQITRFESRTTTQQPDPQQDLL